MSTPAARAGFRLHRLEVLNWGTFDRAVWGLELGGNNTLLTGEIGAGKSTLIDAITTLLVAAHRVAYNKAAGAQTRERNLLSYVLGYWRSVKSDLSSKAKPESLRERDRHSVILGLFIDEALGKTVTLAQVFWCKDEGQPERMFVVADAPLSIKEHFTDFGGDIRALRKRLQPQARVCDAFPAYAQAFYQRMGLSAQAVELFHQTVSMKAVENLTDFVREHMLEASDMSTRVAELLDHFENLTRSHELVITARKQVQQLQPIVENCKLHAEATAEEKAWVECRNALSGWVAAQKKGQLEERAGKLRDDIERHNGALAALDEERRAQSAKKDELIGQIGSNGGNRLAQLDRDISAERSLLTIRNENRKKYATLTATIDLPMPTTVDEFLENRARANALLTQLASESVDLDARTLSEKVAYHEGEREHETLKRELTSLRQRRSSLPSPLIDKREALCAALPGISVEDLPFVGELIQVRDNERAWEGAIERVLNGFARGLIVPNRHFYAVKDWVKGNHLGLRLDLHRVHESIPMSRKPTSDNSLLKKVQIQSGPFRGWIDQELSEKFNFVCCETAEDYEREPKGLTPEGFYRAGRDRHVKDDRNRIDDRRSYLLGWSNAEKIGLLEKSRLELEAVQRARFDQLVLLSDATKALNQKNIHLRLLVNQEHYGDLDAVAVEARVRDLEAELASLRAASDVLQALEVTLDELKVKMSASDSKFQKLNEARINAGARLDEIGRQIITCDQALDQISVAVRESVFPRIDASAAETPPPVARSLTVESSVAFEHDWREWLQGRISAVAKSLNRLNNKIVGEMTAFNAAWPTLTQEIVPDVESAAEYRSILSQLVNDDLPSFEAKFKQYLNENTIRDVVNFQGALHAQQKVILTRIAAINSSLHDIDYHPGTFICLEATPTTDVYVQDFQSSLRACTANTLTGSEDDAYSEQKFEQVSLIVARLRGRENRVPEDAKWRDLVIDVRNWFEFAAAERRRSDDALVEHFSDTDGKSGGQKEQLAYTVLAASLAYQFGVADADRQGRFRFVVIDEAFGRGSESSAKFGLELFQKLDLQLLIANPIQKVHTIEPYVHSVGWVHIRDGKYSMIRNLTIEEHLIERSARKGA